MFWQVNGRGKKNLDRHLSTFRNAAERCLTELGSAFSWSAGSSPAVRTGLFVLAAALAGCDRGGAQGPLVVSAVSGAEEMLTDATAQGLVRFDAAGQVEPGLAGRWIVIDDGTRYIFRLREARWPNGGRVTADQVAARLRARLAPRSGNPLLPYLSAVDQVVAMTPEVLEVRLSRQRPDLLTLFAQPALGVAGRNGGTGPLRLAGGLLQPFPDPALPSDDADRPDVAEATVRLVPERTSSALLRFLDGRSDAVTGGGFADWPLVAVAGVRDRDIRRDPAAGLFGLAVARRTGFLADPANRRALSAALDRAAITGAVASGWDTVDRIVPETLDSATPPVVPEWSLLTMAERRAAARARVQAWPGGAVRLAVALPTGPGATLLWGGIAASLRSVGISATRVDPYAPADLRLVDMVAPYDSARWYLANACRPCAIEAHAALVAARDAPTTADRSRLIAEADRLLDADAAFFPLARPLRWSVVGGRATGWQPNARARHPLNRLRTDPT